jgi:hypothetical protein
LQLGLCPFRFCTELAEVKHAIPPPVRQSNSDLPAFLVVHEGRGSRIPVCELETVVGEHLKLICHESLDSRVDADDRLTDNGPVPSRLPRSTPYPQPELMPPSHGLFRAGAINATVGVDPTGELTLAPD